MSGSQAARNAVEAFFASCGVTARVTDQPVNRFDEVAPVAESVSAGAGSHGASGQGDAHHLDANTQLEGQGATQGKAAVHGSAPHVMRNSPRDIRAPDGAHASHLGDPMGEGDGAISDAREAARRAASLAELYVARDAFDGCALKATASRTVQGEGSEGAPLMLIGEAPGQEEDRAGRPFVGRSGQLLDKMLEAIGWPRDSVYISNVIPWRPPRNRTPTPQETAACAVFVRREIALVGPKVIVPMGGSAAKTLLNVKAGIMSQRGRWTRYEDDDITADAMAMYHPAFLLRTPVQKKAAWRDLLSVAGRLREMGATPPRSTDLN